MKTRNGFVSNSSSSSFIAVGVRRKDIPEFKIKEEDKDYFYDEFNIGEDFIGVKLAGWSDECDLSEIEITPELIESSKDECLENAARFGIPLTREQIKLYAGTYAC